MDIEHDGAGTLSTSLHLSPLCQPPWPSSLPALAMGPWPMHSWLECHFLTLSPGHLLPSSGWELRQKTTRHCSSPTATQDKVRWDLCILRVPSHVLLQAPTTTHRKILLPCGLIDFEMEPQSKNNTGNGMSPGGAFMDHEILPLWP